VQNFQKILKDRGYYAGNIDGIVGPLTLAGAKQWIDAEMNIRGWVKPVNDLSGSVPTRASTTSLQITASGLTIE
jgi:hypothetical protein